MDADASPGCPLCEADRFTHWYHEDANGWVADCESCLVPMVVSWKHGPVPDEPTRTALLELLAGVGDTRFGEGRWRLDPVMRQIPDHFHAHCRPVDRGDLPTRLSRYTGVGARREERVSP